MCRAPFSSSRLKTTHVGQVVHSDVCGPMEVATVTPNGERYHAVFKDDHCDWWEVKLLKYKSDVPKSFKNFAAKLEAETDKKATIQLY